MKYVFLYAFIEYCIVDFGTIRPVDMKKNILPTTLPKEFYKFFWDTDASTIDPGHNKMYVISRLLDIGNIQALRWLIGTYNTDDIIKTIKSKRDLSSRSATFWAKFFHINREDVVCLTEPFLTQRKTLWQY